MGLQNLRPQDQSGKSLVRPEDLVVDFFRSSKADEAESWVLSQLIANRRSRPPGHAGAGHRPYFHPPEYMAAMAQHRAYVICNSLALLPSCRWGPRMMEKENAMARCMTIGQCEICQRILQGLDEDHLVGFVGC